MKHKVGDKVKIRKWDDMAREYGVCNDKYIRTPNKIYFNKYMRGYCGKTLTIIKVDNRGYRCKNITWHFTDAMFEEPRLIIEHHGRTTIAHIGKKYGVARCNPNDEYDAMTGDILALQRLYGEKKIEKKIIDGIGHCYGIVGTLSPFKDVNGKTLCVGDCVDVKGYPASFIAYENEYGFYVMGWASKRDRLDIPLRKVKDYDHGYFITDFKIVPCTDAEEATKVLNKIKAVLRE